MKCPNCGSNDLCEMVANEDGSIFECADCELEITLLGDDPGEFAVVKDD